MDARLEPTVIIIFGAAGDLTRRKLAPALYHLFLDKRMPEQFSVVGVDRKEMTTAAFREHLRQGVDCFSRRGEVHEEEWKTFASHLGGFVAGEFGDTAPFAEIANRLSAQARTWNAGVDAVFYLAVPPMDFPNYQAGTWGPEVAAILLAQDGRSWLQPAVPEEESNAGDKPC